MPNPTEEPAPPSYAQATGSSTTSNTTSNTNTNRPASSHLQVPNAHNGIPASARRSMEDEHRPLPPGWVRQWDTSNQHQFFVDTNATPPRSIWHHPYDDDAYLKTLSSEERERIQEAERDRKVSFSTDDDSSSKKKKPGVARTESMASATANTSAPEISGGSSSTGKKEKMGFGQKLKNKVTGTTHEEREADRARRAEEEREYYEAHLRFRDALQRAQMTGQPQWFAKDRDGKDIYIEPPQGMYGPGGGYGQQGYGYNPYASGPYNDPNARFIRPQMPYGRPYGRGYGGGMGLPIAGGLLGGMMLGGLLF